ncbi:zinc finger MYM-type protein 6-like [Macrobrachium rosenbergii]|uniref:zinc finger MYM-type protein 6-like n=1 Tax=Macrobrachium rosenbergii TaxID=79674 RepID=UPI0034D6BCCB
MSDSEEAGVSGYSTPPKKKTKCGISSALRKSAYMAENSVPFSHANHLVEMQKKMFPECQIAQEMKMKKTKASYVIQDRIAWEEKQEIAKICRENRFALIIDESTDIAVSQILAILVRFYDKKRLKVTDALLDIVEVDDASGEGLYRLVKELLISKDIPLTNVIGFASDNCSSMMGSNTGFQAHLKKDVPSIFVIGCVFIPFLRLVLKICLFSFTIIFGGIFEERMLLFCTQ